jgi:hypothetical protein
MGVGIAKTQNCPHTHIPYPHPNPQVQTSGKAALIASGQHIHSL